MNDDVRLTDNPGPIRLYRVPGSASFLNSGDLLLSLLRRSQCWCVDGESKFAMKIQMYIYRIELPFETEEDKAKVEEFERVLDTILQYEKTPCPFKRHFYVELPEESPSPAARKSRGSYQKAKRWEFKELWIPEGADPADYRRTRPTSSTSTPIAESGSGCVTPTGETTEITSTTPSTRFSKPKSQDQSPLSLRPRPLNAYRSITSPSKFPLNLKDPFERASRSTNARSSPKVEPKFSGSEHARSPSPAAQQVSEQSISIKPTPSDALAVSPPPTPHASALQQSDTLSAHQGFRDEDRVGKAVESCIEPHFNTSVPDVQPPEHPITPPESVTASDAQADDETLSEAAEVDSSAAPMTPASEKESNDTRSIQTPSGQLEAPKCVLVSSKTTDISPTTPPQTPLSRDWTPVSRPSTPSSVASPRPSRSTNARRPRPNQLTHTRTSSARSFTSALVSTTYALLMAPPSSLVAVMMQIAARIANGTFGADFAAAYRYRASDGQGGPGWIPGGWEDSGSESGSPKRDSEDGWGGTQSEAGSNRDDDDDLDEAEDDYGFRLEDDKPADSKGKAWGSAAAVATGRRWTNSDVKPRK